MWKEEKKLKQKKNKIFLFLLYTAERGERGSKIARIRVRVTEKNMMKLKKRQNLLPRFSLWYTMQ
jgi:hypothetical protein